MKQYKRKVLNGLVKINQYPVYTTRVYNGHEPFKIVGIRNDSIELEGDFSGGTHSIIQTDWFKIEDCFLIEELCEEQLKTNGCQIHNVNCCGGSKIIDKHTEYWK